MPEILRPRQVAFAYQGIHLLSTLVWGKTKPNKDVIPKGVDVLGQ